MQLTTHAPARPTSLRATVPTAATAPPRPSVQRSEQRRIVQRHERLVSAWLRSLTAR